MRFTLISIISLSLCIALVIIRTTGWCAAPETKAGSVITVSIPAPSLAGNKIAEPVNQDLLIYLPPTYSVNADKRYPVVYFLQGFNEELRYYLDGPYFKAKENLDQFIAAKGAKEIIMVFPNGRNTLKGSFYHNSTVTGNWEDFIAHDTVNYVDAHYRTIANKASRGLGGFSMGGYGSLHIAMKHPELYSSFYCLSAAIVNTNGIKQAIQSWNAYQIPYVKEAYGAAFAPGNSKKYPYANIPKLSGTFWDGLILSQWEEGLGNLDAKVKKYRKNLSAFNGILLEAGVMDEFGWIPAGNQYLSDLLTQNDIKHSYSAFSGSHESQVNERMKGPMLEFFYTNLQF